MRRIDGVDEIVLYLLRHYVCGQFNVFKCNFNFALDALVFVVERLAVVVYKFFKVGLVGFWQCQHGLGLARNGVAHVAAVP